VTGKHHAGDKDDDDNDDDDGDCNDGDDEVGRTTEEGEGGLLGLLGDDATVFFFFGGVFLDSLISLSRFWSLKTISIRNFIHGRCVPG